MVLLLSISVQKSTVSLDPSAVGVVLTLPFSLVCLVVRKVDNSYILQSRRVCYNPKLGILLYSFQGGASAYDEMCLAFFMYYPRQRISTCESMAGYADDMDNGLYKILGKTPKRSETRANQMKN